MQNTIRLLVLLQYLLTQTPLAEVQLPVSDPPSPQNTSKLPPSPLVYPGKQLSVTTLPIVSG